MWTQTPQEQRISRLTHPGNGDRGGVAGPQQHQRARLGDGGSVAINVDSGRVGRAEGHSHTCSGLLRSLSEVKAEKGQTGREDGVPQFPAWRNGNIGGLSLEPGSRNLYSSSAATCYMTLGEFRSSFFNSLFSYLSNKDNRASSIRLLWRLDEFSHGECLAWSPAVRDAVVIFWDCGFIF